MDFGSICLSTMTGNSGGVGILSSLNACVAAPLDGNAVDGFNPDDIQVSASDDDGNVPANTLDGSLSTRWSAFGDGQFITYDLGQTLTVTEIRIAFFRGDERFADFDVETSTNNTTWRQVFSGRQPTQTLERLTFDVADSEARFVRIVGHGNTNSDWNSFTEVEICVEGNATTTPPPTTPTPPPANAPGELVGAYIAYGGSAYGDAVASDKAPLLDGETASIANYSSYPSGLNRVIVDIADLPNSGSNLTSNDFMFAVGNDDDPDDWEDAPTPTGVFVETGAGAGGSDRVTVTFADFAIVNTWLQVSVQANANTGLEQNAVFYFGSSANEGDSPVGSILAVDFTDVIQPFFAQTGFFEADMSDIYDYNRDQTVNFFDAIGAYFNEHSLVQTITPA